MARRRKRRRSSVVTRGRKRRKSNPFQLRTGRPFRFRGRRRRTLRRSVPGVGPATMPVTFKSCNRLLFTSGTAKTLVLIQLNINNLLDLYGDGSSTIQPLGWDQWNNFFLRYRAQSISVTLDWSKEIAAAAHQLPAFVGYHITQESGDIEDTDTFQGVCDLPRTQWKYMPASDDNVTTQRARQTFTVNPMSLFKSKDVFEFDTTTTTAPVKKAFVQLFVGNATNAALANTTTFMSCLVTIRVRGFFHDRLQLPISVQ